MSENRRDPVNLSGSGWTEQQKAHARQGYPSGGGYTKGGCCIRQLARGKRRLAVRLGQRWVKLQLGMMPV